LGGTASIATPPGSRPRLPAIVSLGAGRMGRGIAQAFAYAGHDVCLVDLKSRSPQELRDLQSQALGEIDASLRALAELGAFGPAAQPAIMQRIRLVGRDNAAEAVAGAGLVFEAVPEILEVKGEALAFAGRHAAPDAILASTTSTFLVTELAALVAQPSRFLNAHWLNPAYIIPLVELSAHPGTDAAALDAIKQVLTGIGKVPVVCAAAPGYIVPRLQALIMNESARMIEEGVATAEDIDKATRHGLGFRYAAMGIVEFIDYGGNDILYYASQYLAQALGPRYEAPEIVKRHMREGRIGLKARQGFYDYGGIDEAAYRKDALARILAMLRHQGLLRPPG
jgi:3-hydroxybutyryl-CoA dehydrogenase